MCSSNVVSFCCLWMWQRYYVPQFKVQCIFLPKGEKLLELWFNVLLLGGHRSSIEFPVAGRDGWRGIRDWILNLNSTLFIRDQILNYTSTCFNPGPSVVPLYLPRRKNISPRLCYGYVFGSRRWDLNTLPWWSCNLRDLLLHQNVNRRFDNTRFNHRKVFGTIDGAVH